MPGKHLLHFGDKGKIVRFEDLDVLSDYERTAKGMLSLEEGTFVFVHRVSSNGYYGFSRWVNFSFDEEVLKKQILATPNPAARITMVVGLPRSGKTTHCNEIVAAHKKKNQESESDAEAHQECVVFDDFLSCFDKRDWLRAWVRGAHIVVNDPRLCREENLQKMMGFLRDELRCEPQQLKLVFFANTPDRCMETAMATESERKVEDIREFSNRNMRCCWRR